ncbi:peptidase S8/S53 domain-containing protein [Hypoxylon sp. FL1857]|nr:peptidase S8/S53 domain-containing protein [Hypoxylon sp. FL1857]
MTIECIRALYKIPKLDKASPGNELGIYEFADVYNQIDLDRFWRDFAPEIPQGYGPEVRGVDGGVAPGPQGEGIESYLDLDLAHPLLYPQGIVIYQVDDDNYADGPWDHIGLFNNFLDAIDGSYCTYSAYGETGNNPDYDYSYPDPAPGGYKGDLQCGVYKPTNVISISYDWAETLYPVSYQRRQCDEWMKLGLQGVSVVFSSADFGVQGGPGWSWNSDGCLGNGSIFNPAYPAGCPYITVAGATYLPTGANVTADEEVAANTPGLRSGGGFSNIYAAPDYQKDAVDNYFQVADPIVKAYPYYTTTNNESLGANGGIYNRGGRGYPDVSAVGDNMVVYAFNQTVYPIGGTSASAPIFGSILTLINEARLAAGKSTVGFVNPVLYAHPEVLHDITSGNNSGCGTAGFIASTGWDPVTGLGTPDYPKMLDLWMSLP